MFRLGRSSFTEKSLSVNTPKTKHYAVTIADRVSYRAVLLQDRIQTIRFGLHRGSVEPQIYDHNVFERVQYEGEAAVIACPGDGAVKGKIGIFPIYLRRRAVEGYPRVPLFGVQKCPLRDGETVGEEPQSGQPVGWHRDFYPRNTSFFAFPSLYDEKEFLQPEGDGQTWSLDPPLRCSELHISGVALQTGNEGIIPMPFQKDIEDPTADYVPLPV